MPMRREVKIVKTENEYVKVGDTFIVEMGKHEGGNGGKGGEPKQKKPKTKLPSLRELIMQIQTEVKEMKQDFNNKIDNLKNDVNNINTKIDNVIKLNGLKTK
ncbi:MAG: hypothetical protein LBH55_00735 [Mycoplasmataceae bacterium]|jgi:hypothetical protein|nr:hypothetical protein [Mycoplasmataceae bacterium]